MKGTILRSIQLALFGALFVSLLVALSALSLNDRFLDSPRDGWIVFLVLPLLAVLPAALLALVVGLLPPKGGARHGEYFLALVVALFAVPAGLYLIHLSLQGILAGSAFLTGAVLVAGTAVLAGGSLRIGKMLAMFVVPGGKPRWWPVAALFVILLLLPVAGSRLSTRPITLGDKAPTVFFCMDGANWAVIDPLLRNGELPAFRTLLDEGVRFDMEATGPLMSPILWTTIGSGVSEKEHKVHSFYATASSVEAPRIWDMVEQQGGTVGLLGWPVTWPPRPTTGFLIPSLFARGPETWPPELSFIREIAMREKGKRSRDFGSYLVYGIRSIQYGVRLSTLREAVDVVAGDPDFYVSMSAKRFLKLRMHSDMFVELLERYHPDFSAFYNNVPDVTSHYFWKFFEPGAFGEVTGDEASRYGETIPEAYRRYDAAMGRILRYLPDNANIVVLSDHGLEATETMSGGTIRLILTEKFLDILGLDDAVQGINLASRVYLRPKGGRGSIPDELARMIGDVTVADSGERVFDTRPDEWGNLIVEVNREVALEGRSLSVPGREEPVPVKSMIEETHAKISGVHNPNAILLIKGDKVRRGVMGGRATIYDVAPTALYLMGYPVHDAMTGHVLETAFIDGWMRNHPPRKEHYDLAETPEESTETTGDENLTDVLKSLGYLN